MEDHTFPALIYTRPSFPFSDPVIQKKERNYSSDATKSMNAAGDDKLARPQRACPNTAGRLSRSEEFPQRGTKSPDGSGSPALFCKRIVLTRVWFSADLPPGPEQRVAPAELHSKWAFWLKTNSG